MPRSLVSTAHRLAPALAIAGVVLALANLLAVSSGLYAGLGIDAPTPPLNSAAITVMGLAVLDSRAFRGDPLLRLAGIVGIALAVGKQVIVALAGTRVPLVPGNTVMVLLLGACLIFLAHRRILATQLLAATAAVLTILASLTLLYDVPEGGTVPSMVVYLAGLLVAGAVLGRTAHRVPLRDLLAPHPKGELPRWRMLALWAAAMTIGLVAALTKPDAAAAPIVLALIVAANGLFISEIAGYVSRRPKPRASARAPTELEVALDRALAEGEFRLVYQPQFALTSGRLAGVEVLVRWQDPQKGLISPAEFIPAAEQSGQIRAIGLWILEQACIGAREWREPPLSSAVLFVNVSAVQLVAPDFVDQLIAVLARTGFPPRRLAIELTESALVRRGEPGFDTLWKLHQQGIRIAIDDFGTGYSCLAYLRDLPVDSLKIDRSFVKDLPDHEGAAVIARTIVAMGRGLGLSVVAEGVETEAQARFLKEIDCHKAQGYLYAPPLDSSELVLCTGPFGEARMV